MAALSEDRLGELLGPYFAPLPGLETVAGQGASQLPLSGVLGNLGVYLDLLLRWNERTNLTAIRSAEEMVRRHFGESLFAARLLAARVKDGDAVLDIGSGAGFPGLPLQLLLPQVRVTLAESQGKKSAFLREAVRATGAGAEVWAARAQALPQERQFEAVTMRAVDRPEQAVAEGRTRLRTGGWLLEMLGAEPAAAGGVPVPGLQAGVVLLSQA